MSSNFNLFFRPVEKRVAIFTSRGCIETNLFWSLGWTILIFFNREAIRPVELRLRLQSPRVMQNSFANPKLKALKSYRDCELSTFRSYWRKKLGGFKRERSNRWSVEAAEVFHFSLCLDLTFIAIDPLKLRLVRQRVIGTIFPPYEVSCEAEGCSMRENLLTT